MTFGPGKYDYLCNVVRDLAEVSDTEGGGVAVIVVGGKHGNGFAIQADAMTSIMMSEVLRQVADQMQDDLKAMQDEIARSN